MKLNQINALIVPAMAILSAVTAVAQPANPILSSISTPDGAKATSIVSGGEYVLTGQGFTYYGIAPYVLVNGVHCAVKSYTSSQIEFVVYDNFGKTGTGNVQVQEYQKNAQGQAIPGSLIGSIEYSLPFSSASPSIGTSLREYTGGNTGNNCGSFCENLLITVQDAAPVTGNTTGNGEASVSACAGPVELILTGVTAPVTGGTCTIQSVNYVTDANGNEAAYAVWQVAFWGLETHFTGTAQLSVAGQLSGSFEISF